jgi:glycerol-3-phosphate acyltransferase PlsX
MTTKKYKIAVDAMGGDFAPINEIKGAYEVINDKAHSDVHLTLIGDRDLILKNIKELSFDAGLVDIIHTEDNVKMGDDPTEVFKKKKNSSLYVGVRVHQENLVDAFVSGGNTGAVLSVSTMLLGRIKGVARPTIGSFFPSVKDYPVFILDVGATVDLKPRYLYEYAVMGSIYVREMLGIENPKVGLLNVGEEESKGTDAIRETYQLLKSGKLNFIGNVEGRDIFNATADIVVCDGFVGNIVLKFAESFIGILKSKIKSYSEKGFVQKVKTGLMVPILKEILAQFDYQNYGGVPLLGVNGVVIIGHGKSSPVAVKNMIVKAKEMISAKINIKIENALNN